ncbi:MAG: hypothetical protein WCK35_20275, partial [Chloroflexota bacterium]
MVITEHWFYCCHEFTHGEFFPKAKKDILWCFGSRNAIQNTTYAEQTIDSCSPTRQNQDGL